MEINPASSSGTAERTGRRDVAPDHDHRWRLDEVVFTDGQALRLFGCRCGATEALAA